MSCGKHAEFSKWLVHDVYILAANFEVIKHRNIIWVHLLYISLVAAVIFLMALLISCLVLMCSVNHCHLYMYNGSLSLIACSCIEPFQTTREIMQNSYL